MMKKCTTALVLLLLLLPFAAAAGPASQAGPPARVTFLIGEATVASEGSAPTPAVLFMEVHTGDTLATGEDSKCEVTLADGSILRMGEKGSHRIAAADFSGKEAKVAVISGAGRIWAKVKKSMGKNREFTVGTDKAVCAVRGTAFDVNAGGDATDLSVYEGAVTATPAQILARTSEPGRVAAPTSVPGPHSVSMKQWVEIVSAMQRLVVRADGSYSRSEITEDQLARDAWVRWNRERDAASPAHK